MFCTNLVSGVVFFFALVGLFGLLSHCFSCNYGGDDPSCLPEPECSYGCLDCETSRSGDDDDCVCVVIMVVVLVFACSNYGLPEDYAAPLSHTQEKRADKGKSLYSTLNTSSIQILLICSFVQ